MTIGIVDNKRLPITIGTTIRAHRPMAPMPTPHRLRKRESGIVSPKLKSFLE